MPPMNNTTMVPDKPQQVMRAPRQGRREVE
jgi:hypothetical protein